MDEKQELLYAELDCVQSEIHEIEEKLKDIHIEIQVKGYICFKFIKCGKPKCHCMNGGSQHGPYPHLQWWEKGKIKTKYLNQKNYPKYKKEIEKIKKSGELTKRLAELKKREKQLMKTKKVL